MSAPSQVSETIELKHFKWKFQEQKVHNSSLFCQGTFRHADADCLIFYTILYIKCYINCGNVHTVNSPVNRYINFYRRFILLGSKSLETGFLNEFRLLLLGITHNYPESSFSLMHTCTSTGDSIDVENFTGSLWAKCS